MLDSRKWDLSVTNERHQPVRGWNGNPIGHEVNEGTDAGQQRVLVVEDDSETADYLARLLNDAGYAVVVAGDARAAMCSIQTQPPDLILMDLVLPDIDGFALTKHLRADSLRDIPIVIVSALGAPDKRERGFDVGADDYLVKPFTNGELLSRIALHLRRRSNTQSLIRHTMSLQQVLEHAQRHQQEVANDYELERTMRVELLRSVNSHLQSLCSIFELEYRREAPGPGRQALDRVLPRLRNAALIYQISEALVDQTTNIATLIQTIASSLKTVYSPRRRIPVEVEIPNLDVPSAIASPMAMIVTELVTNAFKHAFPGGRFGKISVVGSVIGNRLILQVLDDGVGLPTPHHFQRGLSTVQRLVDDLGGTFSVKALPQGTCAEVELPEMVPGNT